MWHHGIEISLNCSQRVAALSGAATFFPSWYYAGNIPVLFKRRRKIRRTTGRNETNCAGKQRRSRMHDIADDVALLGLAWRCGARRGNSRSTAPGGCLCFAANVAACLRRHHLPYAVSYHATLPSYYLPSISVLSSETTSGGGVKIGDGIRRRAENGGRAAKSGGVKASSRNIKSSVSARIIMAHQHQQRGMAARINGGAASAKYRK